MRDVSADAVWVSISYRVTGRIEPLEITDDLDVLRNLAAHYTPGMPLKVRVLAVETKTTEAGSSTRLDLSLRAPQGLAAGDKAEKGQEGKGG